MFLNWGQNFDLSRLQGLWVPCRQLSMEKSAKALEACNAKHCSQALQNRAPKSTALCLKRFVQLLNVECG